jgi:excisionase family DNA binding protein
MTYPIQITQDHSMNNRRKREEMRDSSEAWLTISQTAKLLHVSSKTLRRWEQAGIIHSQRNKYNHRLYARSTVIALPRKKHEQISNRAANDTQPQYYTVSQAADKLNVSVKTLRRWEKAQKLTCARNQQGQRLFPKKEVDSLLERQRLMLQNRLEIRSEPHTYHRWYATPLAIATIYFPLAVSFSLIGIIYSIHNPTISMTLTNDVLASSQNAYISKVDTTKNIEKINVILANSDPIPPTSQPSIEGRFDSYYALPISIPYITNNANDPNLLPESLPINGSLENININSTNSPASND